MPNEPIKIFVVVNATELQSYRTTELRLPKTLQSTRAQSTINHFARQVIPFSNYFVCEKVLGYFGFRWTVTKVMKFLPITSRYVITIVSKKFLVVDIVKFV